MCQLSSWSILWKSEQSGVVDHKDADDWLRTACSTGHPEIPFSERKDYKDENIEKSLFVQANQSTACSKPIKTYW
jgi:hypothetical protein